VTGGKFKALGKEISIMADRGTNSLIVYAEPDDYNTIKEMIKKLDIPRKQVYILALLMEVSPTEISTSAQNGLHTNTQGRWMERYLFLWQPTRPGLIETLLGTLTGTGGSAATSTLGSGFSMGMLGEPITIGSFTFPSLAVLIEASESLKTTNILSKPQLMTLNNEQASINISTNRPFRTTETLITGGGTSQNFDYRDIGIKLQITPYINKGGKIKLELNLEVSKLAGAVAVDQPITLKRAIDTVVEVNNRNTIVIGGLIEEQKDFSKNAVPCLGGMPALGWLFKTTGTSNTKTNLSSFSARASTKLRKMQFQILRRSKTLWKMNDPVNRKTQKRRCLSSLKYESNVGQGQQEENKIGDEGRPHKHSSQPLRRG